MKNLSSLGQRFANKDKEDKDEKNAKTNPFDGLVSCFLFAWFIAGMINPMNPDIRCHCKQCRSRSVGLSVGFLAHHSPEISYHASGTSDFETDNNHL